ncbi:hypothetical protein [Ancylobacter vacuolatus]|uniref:Ribbon-helix-helix protein, copG family n=1 Tax=Ancylobacter vacuolatus TaxID=223389 RepID=A0ABU0DMP5_9HYPH|nr:hypothetical protein [Ancylobacter vacuolatus]MDQ0349717.1 hypothetical protein [Ancylobacter vacuolatus]
MTAATPKRPRGRPPVADDSKAVRINISLSPEAVALIDARVEPGQRSKEIERLIMESVDKPAG